MIPEYNNNIPRTPFSPFIAKYHHKVELAMYFSLSIGALYYTPNQGIYISGNYKHVTAEENLRPYMD